MKDNGLMHFIISQNRYKWLLIVVWSALIAGLLVKNIFYPTFRIYLLIFFAVAIPIGLVIINLVPYSFHTNWIKLLNKFSDGSEIKRDLKVHIRNFDPWNDLQKKHNWFNFTLPYYDFEKADIVESKDLILIYGKNGTPFSYYKNTRPFGLCVGDKKTNDPDLYLVNLVSISRARERDEIVFTDHNFLASGKITLVIYNRN
jgi:hypothetical protein